MNNPSFQQIAELFQLNLPTGDATTTDSPRKAKGKDAEESDQLGREALGEGDYQTAIKHFQAAVQQREAPDPRHELDLGAAYEYADQEPQALRQYKRAARLKGDNPEPFLGLSDVYKRHGKYRDATEKLETAFQLDPKNPLILMKLAEMFLETGHPERALKAAQDAATLKPEDAFFHYWIGDLLIKLGRHQEALDSLRTSIELSPGDDFLYLRAAVAFWRANRKPEAVKAIRLASDLDPEKHVYHGILEILLEELGLQEEADLESKRADKMDRYDQDTLERTLTEMGIEI